MSVLNPNLCYNEAYYKRTAMFLTLKMTDKEGWDQSCVDAQSDQGYHCQHMPKEVLFS